jgi:hypothetical protein
VKAMSQQFTAVIKHESPWWIGWIVEVPGANCQERNREELLITLKQTWEEALACNRLEAIEAAGAIFERDSKIN